ncbi:MAG TPA: SH3 domain-containing protein [Caulobacteraceae bacterium]|jgi:SH3-like domain-containing protein|nr:SH3 domain-containing protein [Caulobacteraceae bacterium]
MRFARGLSPLVWTMLFLLLLTIAWKTGAAAAAPPRPTPSGLSVPRYVSLKFGEVNARAGPGDDYRALWTYRIRGLPLQVIAETADWRRVCDPEGAVAWVHQRTVDNVRRTVMRTQSEPLVMHRRPDAKSPPAALLAGRSLATLGTCRAGWCQVSAGRAKGWAPAAELWGTADAAQCRPRLAKAGP